MGAQLHRAAHNAGDQPTTGPLGSAPPRRRVDRDLCEDGMKLEREPAYRARMAGRRRLLKAQAVQLAVAGWDVTRREEALA
jgi:hypothetical protein